MVKGAFELRPSVSPIKASMQREITIMKQLLPNNIICSQFFPVPFRTPKSYSKVSDRASIVFQTD